MQTEKQDMDLRSTVPGLPKSWHNSGCVQSKEDDRPSPADCLTRPTTLRGTLTHQGMF